MTFLKFGRASNRPRTPPRLGVGPSLLWPHSYDWCGRFQAQNQSSLPPNPYSKLFSTFFFLEIFILFGWPGFSFRGYISLPPGFSFPLNLKFLLTIYSTASIFTILCHYLQISICLQLLFFLGIIVGHGASSLEDLE